ncbi:hypothetical protein TD95_004762 [Thielaviopsis punctulata]|uniref:Uncharacterized protein n=1 Tax=Thielaviopsis punctulata TaxID=72032 RepID=A0A0F4ZE11_9PEZI|nr:hypothetical protein TD95_004762 [Thielaviopsis punctulata]
MSPSSRHRRNSRSRSRSRSRSPRSSHERLSNHDKSRRQRSPAGSRPRHRHRSSSRTHKHDNGQSRHGDESRHKDDDRRKDHNRHREKSSQEPPEPVILPYDARQLSKRDFAVFIPMLAYYIDLQKQKDLLAMDEREIKGRWKSFMGKWNRAELASGWYDPAMFTRAQEVYADEDWSFLSHSKQQQQPQPQPKPQPQSPSLPAPEPHDSPRASSLQGRPAQDPSDSDSDSIGPAPAPLFRANAARPTAAVPRLDDLRLRDEDHAASLSASLTDLRHERRLDRAQQKERLEELVPRADPGSRERKLEKKAEVREKLRPASPGAEHEVDDAALMGGGDTLADFKRQKEGAQRKKSERERRREEIWRAKQAEREERLREYREKEDATVQMLKQFARTHGNGGM